MPKGSHGSHSQTRSYTDSYQRLAAKPFRMLLDAKLGHYTLDGIKQSKEHCRFELIAAAEWPRVMIFTIQGKKVPIPLQTDNSSASNKLYLVCPCCIKQRQHLYAIKNAYVCRECLGTHYRSQSESKIDRLARRIRKTRTQIWGVDWPDRYNLIECSMWWPKPKGLHNAKFDKVKTELYKLELEYNRLLNIKLGRMFGI